MMLRICMMSVFFAAMFAATAQERDSLILSFPEFIKTVRENHPISKQSGLIALSADAGLRTAKGNFDPRIYYSFDEKEFDDKNYWTLQNGGVRIPTPVGLDVSTGIEQSSGPYLNDENISSPNGLVYTQLSMPLLQGLLIDERRYSLKNARLIQKLASEDQKNMLNELFSKASKAYFEWVQCYYNVEILRESVKLANQRLQNIKGAARLGDLAAVDTMEASIQYQDRQVTLQQQEVELYYKQMMLSVFLWNEKSEPVAFSSLVVPPGDIEFAGFNMLQNVALEIDSLVNLHPNMLVYQNKLQRLELELKLKQDKLKPVLNAKFNPLYEPGNLNSSVLYGTNSYKWGVSLQFPVFLRKERGEIETSKIKLLDLNYEIQTKRLEIINKVKASSRDYINTKAQLQQYGDVVQSYYKLLSAEMRLFEIGESSVFMVNNREVSYINARIKQNDLLYKYRKASMEVLYHLGQLYTIQ